MDYKGKSKRKISNTVTQDSQDSSDHFSLEPENSDSEYSDEEHLTYVEETSESEPELECDLWDDDCRIIEKSVSSLTGYHLMPTCSKDPDLNPCKRQKITPEINRKLLDESFIKQFHTNWNNNSRVSTDEIEIIVDPYKLCVVNNFIENPKLLDVIRQEFYELDWNHRNMDLYEFFQSKDLKYLKQEQITNIHQLLKTDVMNWVANLTGLNLTHISATCSFYSNTDYLLVHDDQKEDVMVAFILYLTNPTVGWNSKSGGALQLFGKDQQGQPAHAVHEVYPSNNKLVFFPVTNETYHQVAEVTSLDECRLSINGWFYSKTAPVYPSPPYTIPEVGLYSRNVIRAKQVDIELDSWINEDYLEGEAIQQIQQHIEENSEISLRWFFKPESFSAVLQILRNEDLKWLPVGPPNRYCYEVVDTAQLPHSLHRFLSLFQSTKMFALLQQYTDLDLGNVAKASVKFELQRWTPGCYALLSDYNWQEKNELDLIIYFGCGRPSDIIGASTQYVTVEDEVQNALITIKPEDNNLNIVYRDSARFTKYFSKQSKCQVFYALVCSYSE